MHVQRLTIENIRSLQRFDLDLRREESLAGWHVLLGDNGAGKSTVVRALALALMGQSNAHATRQDWFRWLSAGSTLGQITAKLIQHEQDRWRVGGRVRREPLTTKVSIKAENSGSRSNGQQAVLGFPDTHARRSLWEGGEGWFSASFGPFRRFTGGDREMDKLYLTHPRLAPHLSAFGENVALGESLLWLTNLQVKFLEGDDDARDIIEAVQEFIDDSELLPHGARIARVTSERIDILDGRGAQVAIEDMSDGYRSILSLTLELIRLMFSAFDAKTALDAINLAGGTIALPAWSQSMKSTPIFIPHGSSELAIGLSITFRRHSSS